MTMARETEYIMMPMAIPSVGVHIPQVARSNGHIRPPLCLMPLRTPYGTPYLAHTEALPPGTQQLACAIALQGYLAHKKPPPLRTQQ